MTVRWTDAGIPPINPPGCAQAPLPDADDRLAALAERVHADLHLLRHPETTWMPERAGPDGQRLLDVLIVGAGQGGLGIAAQVTVSRLRRRDRKN